MAPPSTASTLVVLLLACAAAWDVALASGTSATGNRTSTLSQSVTSTHSMSRSRTQQTPSWSSSDSSTRSLSSSHPTLSLTRSESESFAVSKSFSGSLSAEATTTRTVTTSESVPSASLSETGTRSPPPTPSKSATLSFTSSWTMSATTSLSTTISFSISGEQSSITTTSSSTGSMTRSSTASQSVTEEGSLSRSASAGTESLSGATASEERTISETRSGSLSFSVSVQPPPTATETWSGTSSASNTWTLSGASPTLTAEGTITVSFSGEATQSTSASQSAATASLPLTESYSTTATATLDTVLVDVASYRVRGQVRDHNDRMLLLRLVDEPPVFSVGSMLSFSLASVPNNADDVVAIASWHTALPCGDSALLAVNLTRARAWSSGSAHNWTWVPNQIGYFRVCFFNSAEGRWYRIRRALPSHQDAPLLIVPRMAPHPEGATDAMLKMANTFAGDAALRIELRVDGSDTALDRLVLVPSVERFHWGEQSACRDALETFPVLRPVTPLSPLPTGVIVFGGAVHWAGLFLVCYQGFPHSATFRRRVGPTPSFVRIVGVVTAATPTGPLTVRTTTTFIVAGHGLSLLDQFVLLPTAAQQADSFTSCDAASGNYDYTHHWRSHGMVVGTSHAPEAAHAALLREWSTAALRKEVEVSFIPPGPPGPAALCYRSNTSSRFVLVQMVMLEGAELAATAAGSSSLAGPWVEGSVARIVVSSTPPLLNGALDVLRLVAPDPAEPDGASSNAIHACSKAVDVPVHRAVGAEPGGGAGSLVFDVPIPVKFQRRRSFMACSASQGACAQEFALCLDTSLSNNSQWVLLGRLHSQPWAADLSPRDVFAPSLGLRATAGSLLFEGVKGNATGLAPPHLVLVQVSQLSPPDGISDMWLGRLTRAALDALPSSAAEPGHALCSVASRQRDDRLRPTAISVHDLDNESASYAAILVRAAAALRGIHILCLRQAHSGVLVEGTPPFPVWPSVTSSAVSLVPSRIGVATASGIALINSDVDFDGTADGFADDLVQCNHSAHGGATAAPGESATPVARLELVRTPLAAADGEEQARNSLLVNATSVGKAELCVSSHELWMYTIGSNDTSSKHSGNGTTPHAVGVDANQRHVQKILQPLWVSPIARSVVVASAGTPGFAVVRKAPIVVEIDGAGLSDAGALFPCAGDSAATAAGTETPPMVIAEASRITPFLWEFTFHRSGLFRWCYNYSTTTAMPPAQWLFPSGEAIGGIIAVDQVATSVFPLLIDAQRADPPQELEVRGLGLEVITRAFLRPVDHRSTGGEAALVCPATSELLPADVALILIAGDADVKSVNQSWRAFAVPLVAARGPHVACFVGPSGVPTGLPTPIVLQAFISSFVATQATTSVTGHPSLTTAGPASSIASSAPFYDSVPITIAIAGGGFRTATDVFFAVRGIGATCRDHPVYPIGFAPLQMVDSAIRRHIQVSFAAVDHGELTLCANFSASGGRVVALSPALLLLPSLTFNLTASRLQLHGPAADWGDSFTCSFFVVPWRLQSAQTNDSTISTAAGLTRSYFMSVAEISQNRSFFPTGEPTFTPEVAVPRASVIHHHAQVFRCRTVDRAGETAAVSATVVALLPTSGVGPATDCDETAAALRDGTWSAAALLGMSKATLRNAAATTGCRRMGDASGAVDDASRARLLREVSGFLKSRAHELAESDGALTLWTARSLFEELLGHVRTLPQAESAALPDVAEAILSAARETFLRRPPWLNAVGIEEALAASDPIGSTDASQFYALQLDPLEALALVATRLDENDATINGGVTMGRVVRALRREALDHAHDLSVVFCASPFASVPAAQPPTLVVGPVGAMEPENRAAVGAQRTSHGSSVKELVAGDTRARLVPHSSGSPPARCMVVPRLPPALARQVPVQGAHGTVSRRQQQVGMPPDGAKLEDAASIYGVSLLASTAVPSAATAASFTLPLISIGVSMLERDGALELVDSRNFSESSTQPFNVLDDTDFVLVAFTLGDDAARGAEFAASANTSTLLEVALFRLHESPPRVEDDGDADDWGEQARDTWEPLATSRDLGLVPIGGVITNAFFNASSNELVINYSLPRTALTPLLPPRIVLSGFHRVLLTAAPPPTREPDADDRSALLSPLQRLRLRWELFVLLLLATFGVAALLLQHAAAIFCSSGSDIADPCGVEAQLDTPLEHPWAAAASAWRRGIAEHRWLAPIFSSSHQPQQQWRLRNERIHVSMLAQVMVPLTFGFTLLGLTTAYTPINHVPEMDARYCMLHVLALAATAHPVGAIARVLLLRTMLDFPQMAGALVGSICAWVTLAHLQRSEPLAPLVAAAGGFAVPYAAASLLPFLRRRWLPYTSPCGPRLRLAVGVASASGCASVVAAAVYVVSAEVFYDGASLIARTPVSTVPTCGNATGARTTCVRLPERPVLPVVVFLLAVAADAFLLEPLRCVSFALLTLPSATHQRFRAALDAVHLDAVARELAFGGREKSNTPRHRRHHSPKLKALPPCTAATEEHLSGVCGTAVECEADEDFEELGSTATRHDAAAAVGIRALDVSDGRDDGFIDIVEVTVDADDDRSRWSRRRGGAPRLGALPRALPPASPLVDELAECDPDDDFTDAF